MAVTVLIKRKVTAGNRDLLENLYQELNALARTQKGYMESKSMRRVDVPDEHLIITTWKQIEDWSKWLISEGRMEYQERIDALTDAKTKFEIYEH